MPPVSSHALMVAALADPQTMQSRSPLTVALFGLVAAYYATFAIGVLAWDRRARLPVDDAAPTPLA